MDNVGAVGGTVGLQASAAVAAMQKAMQEASESPATTRMEAAHGDRQAAQKIARMQQRNETPAAAAGASQSGRAAEVQKTTEAKPAQGAPREGVGKVVDLLA